MIRKTFRIARVVLAAFVVVVVPPTVSPGTAESSGAGPDCSGWLTKAFWQAAAAEDAERCLAVGAEVDARDWEDWTPLHYAASSGKMDMVNALIAAGAKVDARTDSGATPLHYAMGWDKPDMVNALIAAGAKVDARNREGLTPLLTGLKGGAPVSSFHASKGTVSTLVAAGAKVNVRDSEGWTPLHWAVGWGMTNTVNALIAAGAKVDARARKGLTPLQRGLTPLHVAAGGGRAEIIIALLDSGASAAARTDSGHTAFDFARMYQAYQGKKLRTDALRGTDALRRLRDATPK